MLATRQERTPQAELQFVVRLAFTDYSSLREGARLTLREDFADFLGMGIVVQSQEEPRVWADPRGPSPLKMTDEELISLQKDMAALLDNIVKGREFEREKHKAGDEYGIASVRIASSDMHGSLDMYVNHRGRITIAGSTREVALMKVIFLLSQHSTDNLLRCLACGTVFYRTGRRLYCSPSCATRERQRRYRTDDRKEIENALRRERYKERIRKKTGAPLKVGRGQKKG